jgi:3-methyladenine DNA glycosylase AlkD
MAFDSDAIAAGIEARVRAQGSPERAEGEKRYLKSELEFFGTTVGPIRREVKSFGKDNPDLTHDELIALVEALWWAPVFERRLAACFLLEAYPGLVEPSDLPLLLRLVRESKTWALVDVLAKNVLGELLVRRPDAAAGLDSWADDSDFWVRRSALLAQLEPLRRGASSARFAAYADAMLDEKEFFIRKAIGWVLRETGKTRPQEVYGWLAPRTARVSGVTIREAVKYLDPDDRAELLAAYSERRPAGSMPSEPG